jgi:hypothetical protein
VVQVLGHPLQVGSRFEAVSDGDETEVLVRAAQGTLVAEDRFARLGAPAGQHILLTVSRGNDGPAVVANGRLPVERRIVEQSPR